MEQDKSAVYNMYMSFKSAGRFNYHELRSLFSMGPKKRAWEEGVFLQTLIHNLSIGRPSWPGLVDAIVAERHRDGLNSLYQYSIDDLQMNNPNCFRFRVVMLPHGSCEPFASFVAVMITRGAEDTRDWYVDHIEQNSMEIYSIAEPAFQQDESGGRFDSYTIFDNLPDSVDMDEKGTLYLQCLQEQIRQYAGKDMEDLFHKFRVWADVMLELHSEYKLRVRYEDVGDDRVRLQASVYKEQPNSTGRYYVAQFNEVMKKVR